MKILVINGPNLNMLGIREPDIYGNKTYEDLEKYIKHRAKEKKIKVKILQSNYEGSIIMAIQRARGKYNGIIINAAAYTHTSVAILDALKAAEVPAVEVHLSEISEREEFRHYSYVSLYAEKVIAGKGFDGYGEALDYLVEKYLT